MPSPSAMQWDSMFQAYAICTLVLYLKYFITSLYAADQDNHPEEDKMLSGGEPKSNPPDIKRRVRVFANDLENIPFHTTVFWGAFIVQCFVNLNNKNHGERETVALTALIVIYSGLRFLYSACYIYAIQPVRSIAYIFANLAVLAAACILVASAFKIDTAYFLP